MNISLYISFSKKALLGFVFLGALQSSSASMQKVRSMRLKTVGSFLERNKHKPKFTYFYLPDFFSASKESETIAKIVESYIPRTYAQIIRGDYSFIASPTKGVVGFKRRPGKKPLKFLVAAPEKVYTQNTESIALTLSPDNEFLGIVCVESNGDHVLRHYIIEDALLRRGYPLHTAYLKQADGIQGLSNAQELGEFVALRHDAHQSGVEFENGFFRTITSDTFLEANAVTDRQIHMLHREHLKNKIAEVYRGRTFTRSLGLAGCFTLSCFYKDPPPKLLLAVGAGVSVADITIALHDEGVYSRRLKETIKELKLHDKNFKPAIRKLLKSGVKFEDLLQIR